MPEKPRKIDHVSMAVHDLDAQIKLFRERYGMKVVGRWHSEHQEFKGATLAFEGGGMEFEFISPTTETSFVARFLEERGPGLHHITFEVDDTYRWADHLRAKGIKPFGGVRDEGGWRETFVHPRDSGGVLYQFYEEAEDHKHEHADHGHEED
ncbi:MAG: VOC family protein [Dehalococcoidia bacterium]